MPRSTAVYSWDQKMVTPSVCDWLAPRPRASRPMAASMAPATAPTKLATMKGIRLGMISRKIRPQLPTPLARATST